MKRIIVIINLLFFLLGFKVFSQEIVIPKDTIYLKYKPNDGSLPLYRGKKFRNKQGVNFNIYEDEGLIYPKKGDSDTLDSEKLKYHKFTKINDLDGLVKEWHKKTKPLLIKKYGNPYPNTTNKNNMFVTYLVEEFDDCFIRYRVYWRHQKP